MSLSDREKAFIAKHWRADSWMLMGMLVAVITEFFIFWMFL